MKIEINLPVFADLPADQQITIYREIQNSIQAMSDDKALPLPNSALFSRCWGNGTDGKIDWTFEKCDD